MFYNLYFSSECSLPEMETFVRENIMKNSDTILSEETGFSISSDSFTLRFMAGNNHIDFACQDYNLSFSCCFWFDIIVSSQTWAEEIIAISNKVLDSYEGDLVLESNGEKPILLRSENELYVDKNIGDGSFPFNYIKQSYKEKNFHEIN